MKQHLLNFRLLLIGLLGYVTVFAQQDPQYTQFQFNPLLYNPAVAGSVEGMEVTALGRIQWAGLAGAPQSQYIGLHLPLYGFGSGIGLHVQNDILGQERTTGVYVSYSYILEVAEGNLHLGVSGGLVQRSLDGNELRAPDGTYEGIVDHNDNFLPITNVSGMAPDFGLGLWYHKNGLEAGISATHLLEPDVTLDIGNGQTQIGFGRHVYTHLGYNFEINDDLRLKPAILYKTDLVGSMFDFNALLYYRDNIWGGATFRTYFGGQSDAVSGMIGANIARDFGLGYAYDATLSDLRTVSSGSHELVLRYLIAVEKPRQGKRINSLRYLYY